MDIKRNQLIKNELYTFLMKEAGGERYDIGGDFA